jgi:hypothetical protein
MNVNLPPAQVVLALERMSGGRLTRQRDLEALIELSRRGDCGDVLADLSFHAKFVTNSSRTLQRVGPDTDTVQALSAEMQKGLETVKMLAGELLRHGSDEHRTVFEATYFRLTPEALHNLVALCYDLSWYKNWLLDSRPQNASRRSSIVIWRSALLALVIGTILWLGSLTARAVLANDILDKETMTVSTTISPDAERQVYREWSELGIVMIAGYLLVLISSIVFLIRSPFRLREHGWLLMAALLLFVFVPVEVFVMVLDVRMILMEFLHGGTLPAFREVFLARITALAGAPLIAVLCYYTIIALAIFQPFRRERGAAR